MVILRRCMSQKLAALPLSLFLPVGTAAFVLIHPPKLAKHRSFSTFSARFGDSEEPLKIFSQDVRIAWDDRGSMQEKWSNREKGWKVDVEWKQTQFGIGLFAKQDIAKDRVIRIGKMGHNLMQFQSQEEILAFCDEGSSDEEWQARLRYAKDYIWGQPISADDNGYAKPGTDWFYGMWLPGNGLNHNPTPNTVYQARYEGTKLVGIELVALADIDEGDELVDDYRRHGSAPGWLKDFGRRFNVTLNFADCNEFVK